MPWVEVCLEAKGIAGLLSFLKDEENLLPLLQLGAGLSTGSRPGSSFGEGLLTGLNGYIGARNYQDQRKEAAQLREARANVLQRPERLKNIIGQPAGSDALIAPPIPETPQLQIPQGFGGEFSLGQTPQLPTPQVPDLSFQRPATGIYAPENAGDPSYLPRALIAAGEPELGIGLIKSAIESKGQRDFRTQSDLMVDTSNGSRFYLTDRGRGLPQAYDIDENPIATPRSFVPLNQYLVGGRADAARESSSDKFDIKNLFHLQDQYDTESKAMADTTDTASALVNSIDTGDQTGIKNVIQNGLVTDFLATNSKAVAEYERVKNTGSLLSRWNNAIRVYLGGTKSDAALKELKDVAALVADSAEYADKNRFDHYNSLAKRHVGEEIQRRPLSFRGRSSGGSSGGTSRQPIDVRVQ